MLAATIRMSVNRCMQLVHGLNSSVAAYEPRLSAQCKLALHSLSLDMCGALHPHTPWREHQHFACPECGGPLRLERGACGCANVYFHHAHDHALAGKEDG